MPKLTTATKTRVAARPFGHRVFFLEPIRKEGESEGGVYLDHHKGVPIVYGEVTAVHPTCRDLRVGDFVLFLPNRPVLLPWSGGRVWALSELQVLGVIENGTGQPWFEQATD